jgi:hypothetical protein
MYHLRMVFRHGSAPAGRACRELAQLNKPFLTRMGVVTHPSRRNGYAQEKDSTTAAAVTVLGGLLT